MQIHTLRDMKAGTVYLLANVGRPEEFHALPDLSVVPLPAKFDLSTLRRLPLKQQVQALFAARLLEVRQELAPLEAERDLLQKAIGDSTPAGGAKPVGAAEPNKPLPSVADAATPAPEPPPPRAGSPEEPTQELSAAAVPLGNPGRAARIELLVDKAEYFLGENVLLRYQLVQKGDARELDAIGAMPFPEATMALLELTKHKDEAIAAKAEELLLCRVPPATPSLPEARPSPRPTRLTYLADRSWRDDLKLRAVQTGWRLLATEDRERQIRGARLLRSLGGRDDLPALVRVMDKLLAAYKDDATEQRAYLRPATVSEALTDVAGELIKRGARPPRAVHTPGEAAAFLLALEASADFRPAGWQTVAEPLLKHDIPFLRALALQKMPLPLSDAAAAAVADCMRDEFAPVAGAACDLAGKSKLARFRQPLSGVLRTTGNAWVLRSAFRAATACGADMDKLLEILVGRLRQMDIDGRLGLGLNTVILELMISGAIQHEGGYGQQLYDDWQPFLGDMQKAWLEFIRANREALRSGKRFKIGQPPLRREMFPPKFQFNRAGQSSWPDWSAPAGAAPQPGAASAAGGGESHGPGERALPDTPQNRKLVEQAPPAHEPTCVAVLETEVLANLPAENGKTLAGVIDMILTESLARQEGMCMVDRQALDKLLAEKAAQMAGLAGGLAKVAPADVAERLRPFWAAGVLVCSRVEAADPKQAAAGSVSISLEAVAAQTGQLLAELHFTANRESSGKVAPRPLEARLSQFWQAVRRNASRAKDLPLVEVPETQLISSLPRLQWMADDLADSLRAVASASRHANLLTSRHPASTREERLLRVMGLAVAKSHDCLYEGKHKLLLTVCDGDPFLLQDHAYLAVLDPATAQTTILLDSTGRRDLQYREWAADWPRGPRVPLRLYRRDLWPDLDFKDVKQYVGFAVDRWFPEGRQVWLSGRDAKTGAPGTPGRPRIWGADARSIGELDAGSLEPLPRRLTRPVTSDLMLYNDRTEDLAADRIDARSLQWSLESAPVIGGCVCSAGEDAVAWSVVPGWQTWSGNACVLAYRMAANDRGPWTGDDCWYGPLKSPDQQGVATIMPATRGRLYVVSNGGTLYVVSGDKFQAMAETEKRAYSTAQWQEDYRRRLQQAGWPCVVRSQIADRKWRAAMDTLDAVTADDKNKVLLYRGLVLARMEGHELEAVKVYGQIVDRPSSGPAAKALAMINSIHLLHVTRQWQAMLDEAERLRRMFPELRPDGDAPHALDEFVSDPRGRGFGLVRVARRPHALDEFVSDARKKLAAEKAGGK